MKVYWDKTAVIGLVGFTISLLLILCFMDSISHPLVGIFLCLVVSIFCLVIGLILAFIGNGEASYICAAIFGVSFAAFLLGSWHSLQSRLERLGVVIEKRLKVTIMATQVLKFNQAQQAVLNVISCLQSEQDLADLKRTLVKFMNDHLQREMDKLWESGEMSNEKLQKMQSEHLRTAYKLTDK